jgi:hypothetical protein
MICDDYLLVLIDFAYEFLVRLFRVEQRDIYVLLHVVYVATQIQDLHHDKYNIFGSLFGNK